MRANPYSWNSVNPGLLYGRDKLLNEMLSGLPGTTRSSFGLTGGRRMGKTTLLRAVETELTTSQAMWRRSGLVVVPIFIDGLQLPRPLRAEHIWRIVLTEGARGLGVDAAHEDCSDFGSFLASARRLLAQSPDVVRFVVLFDEIEHIVVCDWSPAFFANWRALLTNVPGVSASVTAVFAGASELAQLRRDVGSPLMDVLEWRSLRNLSRHDSQRLMDEPIDETWPEPFVEAVYEETGGHPMLLQYLMQQALARGLEATNAEKAPDVLREIAVEFVRQRGWQLSEWWNKYCSPTAQRIYGRMDISKWTPLSELVRDYGTGAANDAVEVLQHVGLAVEDAEGLAFRRSGIIFQRWHRAYAELTPSHDHDHIVAARLAALSTDFKDKYISAWGILNSELPNYSGAVGELRDVLTLVLHRLAPDAAVTGETGFRLEAGQSAPTRRQRARYAARKMLGSTEQVKALGSEMDLLEAQCDQVAAMVTSGYAAASGLTHTVAPQEMAYRLLRQADSILLQILPGS